MGHMSPKCIILLLVLHKCGDLSAVFMQTDFILIAYFLSTLKASPF